MRRWLWLALLTPSFVQAHRVPIEPNTITLYADPGVLTLQFEAKAAWWIEDVFGGSTPPATDWPNDLKQKAKAYFDKHVVLVSEGRPLVAQWKSARYTQEVWSYAIGAALHIEMTYALPASAQTLSGTITLYKEDYPNPYMKFFSTLHGRGARSLEQVVAMENPTFTLAIVDLTRTPLQRRWANAKAGLLFWQILPGFLILVLGLHLLSASWLSTPTQRLFLLLITAGAAGAATRLQNASLLFGCAAFAALLLWTGVIAVVLRVYRSRLRRDSESLAENLFVSHTRLVGTLSAGVGVYLIVKGF